jgi:hypothetical protein
MRYAAPLELPNLKRSPRAHIDCNFSVTRGTRARLKAHAGACRRRRPFKFVISRKADAVTCRCAVRSA